jgi:hypothetical protein
MGQIITIGSEDGSYQYELPPVPKESDILYYNLPKEKQFWRTPADELKQLAIRDVKKMNEKDRIEYIQLWRDRWENGMWFMNNGEPTYLVGAHVDHLVFNKFDNAFLYYLDSQKERFYFRDLTNKDRICDGRTWIKGRRTGITTEQRTEAIRTVLSGFYHKVGMQSTKLEICQRTLMKPIIDTYISRNSWMREVFYKSNGKKPVKSLSLTTSVLDEENETLGGFIMPFPTVSSALDGDGWMLIVMDELSKWLTAAPYETLEINLKAIVNPGKRGKIDALSTTGDSKEAIHSVNDWHKLIANSNPRIRNANNKTNSGLYKFFVSGIHSLDLVEEKPEVLDKYGFINKEMAEEYLWNNINKYQKDSKEYIFALYKTPMIEAHAMLSSSTLNLFPKIRIAARLKELAEIPLDERPYVRGRLDELQDGTVEFVADDYGMWLWAVHPFFSFERNIDTRNRFTRNRQGVLFPPVNPEGIIGYDPVNYPKETVKSSNFSQACLFIRKKFDYYNSGVSDEVMAMFLGRPDDPHDVNKEAMKACKYTGYECNHERSIAHVYEDFRDCNMLPFLMKGEDGHYGMPPNQKTTKDGVAMLQARYSPPKTEDQKDQIANYPFEDGLRSLDNFDPANTTPSDPTMAEIYCEHGLKRLVYTNVTAARNNEALKWKNELFPKRR